VRERRESYSKCVVGCIPSFLLDNKKEGPRNFSSGCSLHWVNHIYLSLLYYVSSMFYFYICFILLLHDHVFLTPRTCTERLYDKIHMM
jgi:hypothetical protein